MQRDRIALFRTLIRKQSCKLTRTISPLTQEAMQQSPAPPPECQLRVIREPRQQTKQRDANPGRPIHGMIGAVWVPPRMVGLCPGHGRMGRPLYGNGAASAPKADGTFVAEARTHSNEQPAASPRRSSHRRNSANGP